MASLNSSCFGLFHFSTSTFLKFSTTPVKSSSSSPTCTYFVSESSELNKSESPLQSVVLSSTVVQVSCNQFSAAYVTSSGFLYTFGEDPQKFGTLAIKNCFESRSPNKVQVNTRIVSVSLAEKHGAMLSARGEIFTWGSGQNGELGNSVYAERQLPSLVQTAKIFLIKQVVCGGKVTAFVTAGGFVYIYGELSKCKREIEELRQPFTIRGMTEHFIVRVEMCKDLLVMISDQKQAFVTDACMNVNRLEYRFSKLACSDEGIVAVAKSDSLIHEFKANKAGLCFAHGLIESAYFVDHLFSHKFQFFSGFFVGCALVSQDKPIYDVNLQYVSLAKVIIDPSSMYVDSPEPAVKKSVSLFVNILKIQVMSTLKNSLFDIKLFAKYRKMVLEKPLDLILMPVFNKLLKVSLILKRYAWKKYALFIETSKKYYKVIELKRIQTLEKGVLKAYRKIFRYVIDEFELHEFFRNQKNHIAERIFCFCSKKLADSRRQGFFMIKKYLKSLKVVKRKISKLFKLIEKSLKLKLISSLVQNQIIKLKIYNVITQIMAYSAAQSSRVLSLKFFHKWKRNLVNLKIARISQKYLTNVKLKKMIEKFQQLSRKSLKIGFIGVKNYQKPNSHRFKVIFITNSILLILSPVLKPIFQDLRIYNKTAKNFQRHLNKLIRFKFQFLTSSMRSIVSSRKIILLIKLLTRKLTKFENYQHKLKFKAFIKLSSFYLPRPLNSFPDSPKASFRARISTPCLSINTMKLKSKNGINSNKPKTTSNQEFFKRSSQKNKTFPISISINPSPAKLRNLGLIRKSPRSPQLLKLNTFAGCESPDTSFYSSNTEISPRSVTSFQETPPKKLMQWEEQILFLATAMMKSLLKNYMKGYLRLIIK